MFETFEHTADVGLRVRAASLEELFADAGRALMVQLVDEPDGAEPAGEESIELEAARLDDLLFDWLGELLYRFDAQRRVARGFELAVEGTKLRARVRMGSFHPERHRGGKEVKAITYHGLRVERTPEGFLAEVILDI